jgi:hypothetical protein
MLLVAVDHVVGQFWGNAVHQVHASPRGPRLLRQRRPAAVAQRSCGCVNAPRRAPPVPPRCTRARVCAAHRPPDGSTADRMAPARSRSVPSSARSRPAPRCVPAARNQARLRSRTARAGGVKPRVDRDRPGLAFIARPTGPYLRAPIGPAISAAVLKRISGESPIGSGSARSDGWVAGTPIGMGGMSRADRLGVVGSHLPQDGSEGSAIPHLPRRTSRAGPRTHITDLLPALAGTP